MTSSESDEFAAVSLRAAWLLAEQLDDALDALEGMAVTHMYTDDPDVFDHLHMATYSFACEVLIKCRPEKWRWKPTGMVRIR